jgi:hypothetical protein
MADKAIIWDEHSAATILVGQKRAATRSVACDGASLGQEELDPSNRIAVAQASGASSSTTKPANHPRAKGKSAIEEAEKGKDQDDCRGSGSGDRWMAADSRFRRKEMRAAIVIAVRRSIELPKAAEIKTTFAAIALCIFAQGALAKEPPCRDIASSSARLACYDLAFPPKLEAGAVTGSDASRPPYHDPFVAEDARTTAKLKNICRGC